MNLLWIMTICVFAEVEKNIRIVMENLNEKIISYHSSQ